MSRIESSAGRNATPRSRIAPLGSAGPAWLAEPGRLARGQQIQADAAERLAQAPGDRGRPCRHRDDGQAPPGHPHGGAHDLDDRQVLARGDIAPAAASRRHQGGVDGGHVAHVADRGDPRGQRRQPSRERRHGEPRRLPQVRVVRAPDHPRVGDRHRRALGLQAAGHDLRRGFRARVGEGDGAHGRVAVQRCGAGPGEQRHVARHVDDRVVPRLGGRAQHRLARPRR